VPRNPPDPPDTIEKDKKKEDSNKNPSSVRGKSLKKMVGKGL